MGSVFSLTSCQLIREHVLFSYHLCPPAILLMPLVLFLVYVIRELCLYSLISQPDTQNSKECIICSPMAILLLDALDQSWYM